MSFYVCLTYNEWLNLCSVGRIRLHSSRVVGEPEHALPGQHHELFSLAPDRFAIGESADLLVAEVSEVRDQLEGAVPDAHHNGMRWLLLEDVIEFFPVRADDAWAFETPAENARIRLSGPRFESLWQSWTKAERQRQACVDGMALCRLLGLLDEGTTKPEGMEWSDVASLALDSKSFGSRFSGLTVELLLKRDALFNLVRADSDGSAIFVSCPVEWVNIYSGANVLEQESELKDRAHLLHERYSAVPFNTSAPAEPELASFLKELSSKVPAAFNDDWRPATVTLYARYSHKLRFGKPTPAEVVGAVKAAEELDGRQPARLLAFLLGLTLGSTRTHSLERLLQPERFSVTVQATSAGPENALVAATSPEAVTSGSAKQMSQATDVPDGEPGPDAESGPG